MLKSKPKAYEPIGSTTGTAGGGTVGAAPVMAASTTDIGAVLKMPYINPASGTFAADLVTALIAAGLMEDAP